MPDFWENASTARMTRISTAINTRRSAHIILPAGLLELSRLRSTDVHDRSIDVQILRLRRKIEADSARPELIKTERGLGYRFCASVGTVHRAVGPEFPTVPYRAVPTLVQKM